MGSCAIPAEEHFLLQLEAASVCCQASSIMQAVLLVERSTGNDEGADCEEM